MRLIGKKEGREWKGGTEEGREEGRGGTEDVYTGSRFRSFKEERRLFGTEERRKVLR